MLLRKLEVYGFKSFADRSEIEFGPGVTAIVGPNGSGKSNVSDAIRWALGEQSIRNLRGTKTEDVIFAGSTKRRPLGAAEVSLIFDNTDGRLPLEFSEVTITRRAFRTGESEYYINKTQCRLKDIHDLLTDTGLGRDSMTVIGQNKIDELLNAKAEDRRLMFEEVAGITKYKYRKREALRKLDETEQNLTRVQDLTAEIENQLGPLTESAERTIQYNKLYSELTACQSTLLLTKLEHAEKMLVSTELEHNALTDAELSASTSLALLDTERERITSDLDKCEQGLNETLRALNVTNTDIERTDGKIALSKERIAQGQRDSERIRKEIDANQEHLQLLAEKIVAINGNKKQVEDREIESTRSLETLSLQDGEICFSIEKLENQISDSNENTFDHLQELVTERNNYRTVERDLAGQKVRMLTLEKEQNGYALELLEAAKAIDNTEEELKNINKELLITNDQLEKISTQKTALTAECNRLAGREKDLTKQTETLTSRLNVLQAMREEYEGFGRSTKSILKHNAPWSKHICGAVAQLITVPDSYLTAIEIALGGTLQHIVTENDEAAKRAIEYLKEQRLGRTTFLPLTTIRTQKPRENEVFAAQAEGAIGIAAHLIQYDAKFKNIFEYLLGRTIVVKTIDTALKIAKQNAYSLKIVTLDGELITPGGAMTGGSMARRDASILGRQNEIENLEKELSHRSHDLAVVKEQLATKQIEFTNLDSELTTCLNSRRMLEIQKAETTIRLEKVNADYSRLQLAQKTIETEIANCLEEEAKLQQKLIESSKRISQLEDEGTENKNRMESMHLVLKDLKLRRETLVSNLTEERVRHAALKQELTVLTSEIAKIASEQTQKDTQRKFLISQLNQVVQTEEDLTLQLTAEMESREELIRNKNCLDQTREQLYSQKLMFLTETQRIDKESKEFRRKVQSMQSRLHEMQLLAAQYKYEADHSLEQLNERYGLSRDEALSLKRQETREELSAIIYQLEAAIHQLGPINPAAIEEHARIRERYDFLQTQYSDLISAKEYLASIICDIDHTMSKQFTSAFETINQYFQDTFTKLFGGGQAYLQLLEPDVILESGIEIFVQPPGKKQQNLALLSGGERALTVIALLFAFLTFRPAPFSVVDEIDAALDEANVQRFSEFLRDYAQNTQFIVVTHRKGTMEVSDVMIGITMEESGVSKLLSVKFMDKAG
jgi:chromosome segregation protein